MATLLAQARAAEARTQAATGGGLYTQGNAGMFGAPASAPPATDLLADPLGARVAAASAPMAAPRPLAHVVGDNLVGYDDGVTSPGETVGSWVNRAVESGTLGLVGDEANARADMIVGGLPVFRDAASYEDALTRRRADEATFAADHPIGALTADLAGAVIPGMGVGRAVAGGASRVGNALRGLLTGSAAGAAYGFAEGEGGAADRMGNAAVPATLGGVVGGAAPFVVAGAQRTWNALAPGAAAQLRTIQGRLGLDRAGAEIVGDAIARDAPYTGRALAEAGPNAINAETGVNTRALLDWIVNRPGAMASEARNAVEGIATERAGRFGRAMDETLGPPEGVSRRQAGIMQGTAAGRRDAYGAAYGATIDYGSEAGQRLQNILRRVPGPVREEAMRLGRAAGHLGQEVAVDTADDGRAVVERLPDVAQLDYVLRALGDLSRPTLGTGANAAGVYRDLARDLRGAVDELVPDYAAARAAGADAIGAREAVEFGSTLLRDNVTMDVAADTLSAMTEGERRFAAQGLRDRIDETMANANRALTDSNMDAREALAPLRDLLNRAGQAKLVALLGDGPAQALTQAAQEAYSGLTLRASVARGSATAPRQAWEEVLDRAVPVGPVEALQEGRGLTGAVASLSRPVLGDPAGARLAARDDVVERIGRVLLSRVQDEASPIPLAQQLPALLQAAAQGTARVGRVGNALAGYMGAYAPQERAR